MATSKIDDLQFEDVIERPTLASHTRQNLRDHWDDLKGRLVTGFLVAIVVLGAISVVVEMRSLANGDDLSMQERANVTLATQVAAEILGNGEMIWVERAVDDATTIHAPAGTFTGADGARAFASLVAGGDEDRAFEVQFVAANGDLVELDWRLAGPLTPGIVKGEFVGEGSHISGRVVATVMNGSVQELTFLVAP